jgi:hypothetical protein
MLAALAATRPGVQLKVEGMGVCTRKELWEAYQV